MKLASFFALSAALHAAILFYPVSFLPPTPSRIIPVTLVDLDESGGGSGGAGIAPANRNANKTTENRAATNGSERFSLHRSSDFKAGKQTVSSIGTPASDSTQVIAGRLNEPAGAVAPQENSSPSVEAGSTEAEAGFASSAGSDNGSPAGSGLGGGKGYGSGGTGRGSGSGSSNGDFRLTQARYRETPRPLYPEQARAKGQEGRVLLRVLVDREGRSKSVEVSRTSGSETLDRAAIEAIRLWRFSPARYGNKPVESWVRVPIDFRLRDAGEQ